ncbi:MAG: hypothetical protein ACLFTR_00090 [Candidatus Woesearchaeota archaeon]
MPAPKNPNTFFVGIKDTKDLKRAILESTRDSVVFLQRYENFTKIKKEKNEAVEELKKMVKDISTVVADLKRKLPESELHKRLNKEEISVEKDIIGIGIEKKGHTEEKSKKEAKDNSQKRSEESKKQAQAEAGKGKQKKAEKVNSEMEKLENQLKELEGRLRQFE